MRQREYHACLVHFLVAVAAQLVHLPGVCHNQKTGEVVFVGFDTFLQHLHAVTFGGGFGTNGGMSSQVFFPDDFRINLTKIQSLPIIGREWEYQFYVDIVFDNVLKYKQSIVAITPLTKELKILGEYEDGKSTI